MSFLRIPALALLALPFAAFTVQAGPYYTGPTFATYTTTILHTEGQTLLYHGPGQYMDENGVTSEVHGYTYLPTAMDGTIIGRSSEIRYAGQSKESYFFSGSGPEAGSPNDTNTFRIRVTLTDLASGESGALGFDVRGGLSTVLPAELRGEAMLSSLHTAHSAIVLGRNRYELNAYGFDTDSNAWLYGNVTVTENVPEPATLGMAGVGLVALIGYRRRLRHASVTSPS